MCPKSGVPVGTRNRRQSDERVKGTDCRTVEKTGLVGQGLWIFSECVADVAGYGDG